MAQSRQNLKNIRNAEDLVWLPGTDWVVSSGLEIPGSSESGHLYLINATSDQAEIVYPAEGANHPDGALSATCDPPTKFSAHGLGLRLGLNGQHELYVVNDDLSTIDLFTIEETGDKPKIIWRNCVAIPGGWLCGDQHP